MNSPVVLRAAVGILVVVVVPCPDPGNPAAMGHKKTRSVTSSELPVANGGLVINQLLEFAVWV